MPFMGNLVLEFRKSLKNPSGNPEIQAKIFGISEILEISYVIFGSEMPLLMVVL